MFSEYGQRTLKSVHGTYLQANPGWKVGVSSSENSWTRWYIEDHKGKVVFKSTHNPGQFLRCPGDGFVDLVDRLMEGVYWTPLKNKNGSWSFFSEHECWLCARDDQSVICAPNNILKFIGDWNQFWLGRW